MPYDLSFFNQARTAIEHVVNRVYEQQDCDQGCKGDETLLYKIIQFHEKKIELVNVIEGLNILAVKYIFNKKNDTIEQLQRSYENNEISYADMKAHEEYIEILSRRLLTGFSDIIDETVDRLIHSQYANPEERRKEILEMIERHYNEKIVAPLLEYNAQVAYHGNNQSSPTPA